MRIPIGVPWKCALLAAADSLRPVVACYAIGDAMANVRVRIDVTGGLIAYVRKHQYAVRESRFVTFDGAEFGVEQWLLVHEGDAPLILSVYEQPLEPAGNGQRWYGRRVLWVSLGIL
ncbi:MAG: hypothetical protein B7X06_04295 [Verrucomicrobia bacterium 21-51-4]|nr:MAG: hypothetical protein B7X06_04295 [Verrucomicrobia bacterium 21-51-4]